MLHDGATLLDMLKAARLVAEFREGMGKRAFLSDPKTSPDILHQLLIPGAAGKRLSQGLIKQLELVVPGEEDNDP